MDVDACLVRRGRRRAGSRACGRRGGGLASRRGAPRTYADDDPHLAELRGVCLAFPESAEVEAWGRPTFRAGKKMFAVFEGNEQHPYAVVFRPDPAERPALLTDPRFYVPPYYGPSGWLALDLTAAAVDWQEVAELMETSYRQVALQRMLKALDRPD